MSNLVIRDLTTRYDTVDVLHDVSLDVEAGKNQNEIRMGVEIDAIGRPVGYWVWDAVGTSLVRERYFVPAGEMLHLYDPERVNQTSSDRPDHVAWAPTVCRSDAVPCRFTAVSTTTLPE